MQYLLLLCLAVPALSISIIQDPEWHLWKKTHSKSYIELEEERVRHVIWQENMKKIEQFNIGSDKLKLKMNHLGDMTQDEFARKLNGFMGKSIFNATKVGATFLAPNNLKVPEEVDWRKHGYVTPVKNQGHCGSCWAFSTTGSLEGQMFRKTGKLVSLSEQNLVDCSSRFGNHGCEGGLMDNAFRYIEKNKGIDTEKSYPYVGRDGQCHYNPAAAAAEDIGFVDIPAGSESSLLKAVASVGPVSVAIDAGHFSFQFYHYGVYDEPSCSSTRLDHGVLAVGYGVDNGKDFWLVKNSWGPGWGLNGYIKMSRNKDNQCGIASKASYPLV